MIQIWQDIGPCVPNSQVGRLLALWCRIIFNGDCVPCGVAHSVVGKWPLEDTHVIPDFFVTYCNLNTKHKHVAQVIGPMHWLGFQWQLHIKGLSSIVSFLPSTTTHISSQGKPNLTVVLESSNHNRHAQCRQSSKGSSALICCVGHAKFYFTRTTGDFNLNGDGIFVG